MKALDLAYAAGLIDGEGWVGIWRRSRGLDPVIQVGMTSRDAVDWLQRCFGGFVHTEMPTDRNGRQYPLHRWRVSGRAACRLADQLRPYLKVKEPQARLITLWPAVGKGRPGGSAYRSLQERLSGFAHSLNAPAEAGRWSPEQSSKGGG